MQSSRVKLFSYPVSGIFVKFGQNDDSLIPLTMKYAHEKSLKLPFQYLIYVDVGTVKNLIVVLLLSMLFSVLIRFQFGKIVLEKYPHRLSFGRIGQFGPSRENVRKELSITVYWLKGWSNKFIKHPNDQNNFDSPSLQQITRIVGPDRTYVGTSVHIVAGALTILDDNQKLPHYGVLTPGYAFAETNIYEKLHNGGFECKTSQN